MKTKVVRGYSVEDALDSTGCFVLQADLPAPVNLYQCGECNELYEDGEEAKKCCKWLVKAGGGVRRSQKI